MRRLTILTVPILLAVVPAGPAAAQTVRGELVEETADRPISGAFVALLDDAGRQVAGALTDGRGRFIIRAPGPGRYRLRAERIGFRVAASDPFDLRVGATLERRLVSGVEAIELAGVTASAERRCTVRPEAGRSTARLWREATKALAAAAWTEEAGLFRYQVARYVRELDPQNLTVREERRRPRSIVGRQPFEALPPDRLSEGGFVQENAEGRRVYYAPDARVLFSDAFLDTHCLAVTTDRPDEATLVGVGFEPVPGRDVPEVEGVLWLDRETAELRTLEYRYVNLPFTGVQTGELGGRLDFERLPNGAWIVRRWRIRLPALGTREAWWDNLRDRRRVELVAIREEGGEVLEILSSAGRELATAERATLTGIVYDSLRGAPLAGASVFLSGTDRTATTDSAGRFEIAGLSPGDFSLSFTHPLLGRLGVYPTPRPVSVRAGETTDVDLAVPGPAAVAAKVCSDSVGADGAVLIGTVRGGESGEPTAGASIVASWLPALPDAAADAAAGARRLRRVVGFADDRGRFRLCAADVDETVTLAAAAPDGQTLARAAVRADGGFAAQDLTLAPPGRARIVGRVVDIESDEPITGAAVRLQGTGRRALTGDDGEFVLTRVPAGEYDLEIEHIAYGEHTESVNVGDGATIDVGARLAPQAIALEGIEVEARSRIEIETRMRGTRVDMLGGEELDRIRPRVRSSVDLIRSIRAPGLRVTEVRIGQHAGLPDGVCVELHRRPTAENQCEMVLVYVDGVRVPDPMRFLRSLDVSNVERIELLGPHEAGAQYGGLGSRNGVLMIYTRSAGGG